MQISSVRSGRGNCFRIVESGGSYKKPSPSPGGGRGLGLGCSQNIIPDHKNMYLEAHSAPRHSLFQPLVTLCYALLSMTCTLPTVDGVRPSCACAGEKNSLPLSGR